MEHTRVFAFKEILINNLPHYLWFRCGLTDDEPYLVVDEVITEQELFARLNHD